MSKPTVLVIGRNFHPHAKETAVQLAEGLKQPLAGKGLDVETAIFKDLLFDVSSQQIKILHLPSGQDLKDFTVVLMTNWYSHASIRKDMALTIALYLKQNNVPLINSEPGYSRSTSKLSQMLLAAQNNIPIPRTVFSLSLDHLQKYLADQNFATPIIFKDAQASRGQSNFLLDGIDEIAEHKAEHSEKQPFMAQAMVNSDGSDYRFFVTGGQARLAIKRIGSGDSHLNNTSAGATTELTDLAEFDDKLLEMVKKISQLLHRELTGVDIIFDKATKEPYFLEANPIPQIATGSNVPAKLEALAEAIKELAERSKS